MGVNSAICQGSKLRRVGEPELDVDRADLFWRGLSVCRSGEDSRVLCWLPVPASSRRSEDGVGVAVGMRSTQVSLLISEAAL